MEYHIFKLIVLMVCLISFSCKSKPEHKIDGEIIVSNISHVYENCCLDSANVTTRIKCPVNSGILNCALLDVFGEERMFEMLKSFSDIGMNSIFSDVKISCDSNGKVLEFIEFSNLLDIIFTDFDKKKILDYLIDNDIRFKFPSFQHQFHEVYCKNIRPKEGGIIDVYLFPPLLSKENYMDYISSQKIGRGNLKYKDYYDNLVRTWKNYADEIENFDLDSNYFFSNDLSVKSRQSMKQFTLKEIKITNSVYLEPIKKRIIPFAKTNNQYSPSNIITLSIVGIESSNGICASANYSLINIDCLEDYGIESLPAYYFSLDGYIVVVYHISDISYEIVDGHDIKIKSRCLCNLPKSVWNYEFDPFSRPKLESYTEISTNNTLFELILRNLDEERHK